MHKANPKVIRSAILKLKLLVLKVDAWTKLLLFLLAVFTGLTAYTIPGSMTKKQMAIISLAVFFVSWGIFYLLALYEAKRSNRNWRFWVLEQIHFLQDFVEIRKIAEQKNYIKADEKWLKDKFICKKGKDDSSRELLERLTLFEYAFEKDFEASFPKKLCYVMSKSKALISLIGGGLGLFVTFGRFFIDDLSPDPQVTPILIGFAVLLSIPFWYILVMNTRYFFFNEIYLELNQEGVKSKRYKNNTLIPWQEISKIAYITKSVGEGDILHYLYFYFKSSEYYPKSGKDYHRVVINGFSTRVDILLKQVNFMQKQILGRERGIHTKLLKSHSTDLE